MANSLGPRYSEAVCIGMGLSGVCLGVQLRRQYGFTDIEFYERNPSHSGTWWVNQYPGCACDVPAFFYSFSFEPNSHWSRLLPPHDEIRRYIDGVVKKYDLLSRINFLTECESAEWDDSCQLWTVHLCDLATGERYKHQCRLLFSAVGVLVEPKEPYIAGRDTFTGPIFHTARWREDVDLRDKSVVVVGNGCTACQMVPQITPLTKTLTQCIRTPHWLLERENTKYTPWVQWMLKHIPFLSQLLRFKIFMEAERYEWRLYPSDATAVSLRRALEKQSKEFVYRVAPEKYRELLIPDWEIACKRRIYDTDSAYLKTLFAPNLHLTKDPILEILPTGVRTTTATYPADVIILATGFQTNNGLGPLRIRGRGGEWLNDRWRKRGGPGAYNNTAVHGYPNFMMIYGPNSTTGYSSVILAIENMVNYSLKIIEPVLKGEADEFEVNAEAENVYLERLQDASKDKVWNGACNNWYVSREGWNSTLYPWSQIYFWWRCTFPIWKDWTYKCNKSPRTSMIKKPSGFLAFVLWVVRPLLALALLGAIVITVRGGGWHTVRLTAVEHVSEFMVKGKGYLGV